MGITTKYLSDADRERICREICHIEKGPDKKGELWGLCPIHLESETTPSLSFSYNISMDVYHCFSCGADGDLIKLYSEVNHLGQKAGFKSFCEKYNIPFGENRTRKNDDRPDAEISADETIAFMNSAFEKFPPLPEEWLLRLEKERGWSRKWIEILDLRLQTHRLDKKTGRLAQIKKPLKIAIPIRDVTGNLVNIRLYEPGARQFKIISFAQSTGDSRLFPEKPQDGIVLLCEGESDAIAALSHHFNGITQTSKLKNWPKEHLAPFKDRDVIICYDVDQAGQKYAAYAAQALAGTAKSIRVLLWPVFMGVDIKGSVPKDHGQDLTDFFVRHKKTSADLQSLIDSAAPWRPAPVSPGAQTPTNPEGTVEDTQDMQQFWESGINKRFSFKPRLLAEKILRDNKLMFDSGTGLLYRWNDRYWEEHEESHLKKIAVELLRNESQKSRVDDAVFQLKMLSTMPAGRKVNDRMDWINLASGILNINTFEIIPHSEEFYFTQMLPIYFDPKSTKKCDNFLRFLETNIQTPEVIDQLQEFTGYCLVRHAKYEKALYLLGPGADGKSTYMKILRELVGPENCSAVSFGAIEDQFQRSAMFNRLVNLSAEISAESMESQYFKKIVSGDTLQAAYKHIDTFEFDPYCKLVFAGNILPRVRDNTEGYFRKLLPIRFKRQFFEDDPARDPDLVDKLKEELSAIFQWSLIGLKRLIEQKKFTPSNETWELMQDYRRLNNPVLCYVEEECELSEDVEVSKKDLYFDYKNYCSRCGYTPLNRENFFRELFIAVANLRKHRPRVGSERVLMIQGIKIKVVE